MFWSEVQQRLFIAVHMPPLDLKQQGLVVHGCLVGLLVLDVAVVLLQCVLLHLWCITDPVSGASLLFIHVRDDTKVAVHIHDEWCVRCHVVTARVLAWLCCQENSTARLARLC